MAAIRDKTWLVEDLLEFGSFMIEFFLLPLLRESWLHELFLKYQNLVFSIIELFFKPPLGSNNLIFEEFSAQHGAGNETRTKILKA